VTADVAGLSAATIALAVESAGLSVLADGVAEKFSTYFDLLWRWNSKLNLTAMRSPEEILRRHFVECIFCAQYLPIGTATLLDYGSGAGFPGVPIALCRPEIRVTLAESQGKKASFLREVARELGLGVEVFGGRVETMAASRLFDAVAMRAVDRMQEAAEVAAGRVAEDGWLVLLASSGAIVLPEGFAGKEQRILGTESGVLVLAKRRLFHVEQ
jgi:16S rRNA (guanine527-N7)-methyltransferase